MLKFFEPNITVQEIDRVLMALNERHLSDGHIVGEFEDLFKDLFGYKYVVAMNSGTSALYSALLAKGIGHGDEVIVTPYTFIASVHVAMLVGATPVFADIDRQTYNINVEDVVNKLTKKTKAIIPVDVFGVPCQMEALRKAVGPEIFVLQDSIEGLGSISKGRFLGLYADANVYGFSPNKQITTCEGGILCTKDKELHDNVRRIRQHGVKTGDPFYQMMGHNFRMTDLHAALGCAQLLRFNQIQKQVKHAEFLLDNYFFEYRKQKVSKQDYGTLFVYVIELPRGVNKDQFISEMGALGVPVKPYFRNLAELPHLKKFGICPVAQEVGARTVALPTPYTLSEDQALQIWESFKKGD